MAETFGSLSVVLVILALVLAVAWIVLPFALIGTKPLLRQLIEQQQRTNALLEQLTGNRSRP